MSENLIGGVTSVVTADTTKFDAAFKKTGETADATARVVAKAAKLQADGIAFAAKFAGDAVTDQSLRIISARKMEGQALADYNKAQRLAKDGYGGEVEGSNLAAAALQRLTAARLASAEASKVEHAASISQQQAASAAIRGAEGNIGIRAVERFAISIPGVGAALQGLFPIIGMAATAGIIVKMGADLYDLQQKGKHAGEEIARAFSEVNIKLSASNDELELQTSKIEDEIAKLEKTPSNGLKTSLLEAAVAADKLQESLASVLKTERDLLKDKSVSFIEGFVTNQSPTGSTEKEISEAGKVFEREANLARLARRQGLQEAGDDQDKQEAANKKYYDTLDGLAAESARKMRQRATDIAAQQQQQDMFKNAGKASRFDVDLTPTRSLFESNAETYDELQRRAQDVGENFNAEKKLNGLKGAKDLAANQNKAAEELLKSMVAQLHEEQLQFSVTLKTEYDFWELRKSQFVAGSQQYNDVVAKQAAIAEEAAKKAHSEIERFLAQDQRRAAEQPPARLLDGNDAWKRSDAKVAFDRMDTTSQLYAEAQKAKATLETNRVQEESGRTMTQIAAATEMAAIHTREYGAELERLQARQQALRDNPLLTANDADREKQVGELDQQIAKVKSNRQVQILQDSYSVNAPNSDAMIGLKDALNDLTDVSKDNAQIMRQFTASTLNSLNEQLVRGITGQRTDFKGLGRGIATNVASVGLNKAEGAILGGLGFGKKDGSSETAALWVRVVNSVNSNGASNASTGLQGILGMATAPGSSSGDSAGPDWAKLAGTALSFLPGFADGGDLPRSSLVMVGEKGPEVINTGGGGTVIPNHKLPDFTRGGSGDTHVHVDARGSNDPAAVEVAVQKGIRTAAPHIAAAAVKASDEKRMRTPMTKR